MKLALQDLGMFQLVFVFTATSTLIGTLSCAAPDSPPSESPEPPASFSETPKEGPAVVPLPAADPKFAKAPEPQEPGTPIEIERTTRVFATPSRDSHVLGVVNRGARVKKVGESDVATCGQGWIEIAPAGWVCTKTSATDEALTTNALPRLDRRRAVPGTAGTVRDGRWAYADADAVRRADGKDAGGRRVRMAETIRIGDTIYWETQAGELVAARDVRRSRGSSFEGVFLDDESELRLPIAFAHKERARKSTVAIYDEPGGRRIGKLDPREAINIAHTTHNGRWIQLESDGWISGRDARLAELAAPPKTVGAEEPWIDFNRDTQVIVLYRGAQPIYATLTSSGKYGHRTPVGVYRVEKKVAKTTMNSRPDAEEPYEVKNVPWALFFHHGFAVHGAYWHNKFGTPISHGCLNLAPTDAKHVYELLGPEVPAGWSVATATFENPGGVVRVKTKKTPDPELRGSAAAYAESLKRKSPPVVARN